MLCVWLAHDCLHNCEHDCESHCEEQLQRGLAAWRSRSLHRSFEYVLLSGEHVPGGTCCL